MSPALIASSVACLRSSACWAAPHVSPASQAAAMDSLCAASRSATERGIAADSVCVGVAPPQPARASMTASEARAAGRIDFISPGWPRDSPRNGNLFQPTSVKALQITIGGTMKLVVLATVAAASLLAAGCGGGAGKSEIALSGYSGSNSGSGDTAISSAPVQPGTVMTGSGITVVGTGTADVVPDVADWSFGVNSEAATASDALAANARVMNAVVDALRATGIEKADLRTDEVSLYPETADDGRTVTGYSASSTVTATVRTLGKAGQVVDAAVRAGATDVSGPTLRPSDTDVQYRQAVDDAFDDARAHAEAIAAKAGVALGAPVSIAEVGAPAPGPVYDGLRAVAADAGSLEARTQQVTASLTVPFSITAGALSGPHRKTQVRCLRGG